MVTYVVYAVIVHATNAQATWNSNCTIAYTGPIRRIKYGGVEQAALRTGRSPNGGSKLSFFTRNNDDFAEPACSTARTMLKMLVRCVKTTYLYETGTPCPPYLSKIRDLSILPNTPCPNTMVEANPATCCRTLPSGC